MQAGGTPPQLSDQAKNTESGSPALWEFVQKNALDEFKGVKILAMYLHDASLLHFSGKQVKSLEDLKGLKVRGPTRFGRVFDGTTEPAKKLTAAGGVFDTLSAAKYDRWVKATDSVNKE